MEEIKEKRVSVKCGGRDGRFGELSLLLHCPIRMTILTTLHPMDPPLRTYPDRRAPDGIDPFYAGLCRKAATYLSYPLLPLYVLKWLWDPRGQQLPTYLATRVGSWASTLAPFFPVAETWGQASSLPPPEQRDQPYGDAWEGIAYDVATVPPAPAALCGHLAKGPAVVRRVERPMFVLTPAGATADKVVLYFHGG